MAILLKMAEKKRRNSEFDKLVSEEGTSKPARKLCIKAHVVLHDIATMYKDHPKFELYFETAEGFVADAIKVAKTTGDVREINKLEAKIKRFEKSRGRNV